MVIQYGNRLNHPCWPSAHLNWTHLFDSYPSKTYVSMHVSKCIWMVVIIPASNTSSGSWFHIWTILYVNRLPSVFYWVCPSHPKPLLSSSWFCNNVYEIIHIIIDFFSQNFFADYFLPSLNGVDWGGWGECSMRNIWSDYVHIHGNLGEWEATRLKILATSSWGILTCWM